LSTSHLERPGIDRRAALKAFAALPLAFSRREIARQGDWTPLWNGRDLSGWDTYLGRPHRSSDVPGLQKNAKGEYVEPLGVNRDPRGVFSVVTADGAPAIRISGEVYGGLITRSEYENYHLRDRHPSDHRDSRRRHALTTARLIARSRDAAA
jgi:hypothetical protein